MVAAAEGRLDEQRDVMETLVGLMLGPFPYDYLKSLYHKKKAVDPDRTFILQSGESFKRELNFLIDIGYLQNVILW